MRYSKQIPNYENYDIYNLVEVYQRIDHNENKEEIKIIEEQIRKRLNIDPLVELTNPEIKEKFSAILASGKPMNNQQKENYEISILLRRIRIVLHICFLFSILSYYFYERIILLLRLSVAFLVSMIIIEFVRGYLSKEMITLWRSSVNLDKEPFLYRFNQLFLFFYLIIVLVAFFTFK